MSVLQIGALAYLVIGLIIGAIVWAAVNGDLHTCDHCDPDHEHRTMVDTLRVALQEPRTRFRAAVLMTVAISAYVVAWPAALLLGVVMARKEGKR